jgi:NAD(P)-dependent dehydrogenase (short-subunit alcohol dehydrogenase family)
VTRRALVTGASRGIGRAIALRLAAERFMVMCAGRDLAALEQTAGLISAAGGRAAVQHLDLTDAAAIAELPERCGALEVLVANSGVSGPTAPVWELDPEQWAQTLSVNLTAGFLMARAVLPGMVAQGSGSLVFIGSTTAARPLPGRAAYAASKSALVGLVRSLALDAGPFGVRVNLVSPGPTSGTRLDTVLGDQATARGVPPERIRAQFLATSPLGRLTEPSDVADAVAFLAGDRAQAITGAELTVSSGMVMA